MGNPGPAQLSSGHSSVPSLSSVYTTEEFDRIYRENADRVFRQAFRSAGRRDIAEEITGDAFLALYRHGEKLDGTRALAWLITVVRNLAMDYWRRSAVENRYLERVSEPVTEPEDGGWEAILQDPDLKPAHRTCLILRYVHGMDRAEICQATGFAENQVKSYLQYALVILRRNLEGGRK